MRLRRVYILLGLALTAVAVALAWSYFPVPYRRVPARAPDRAPGALYARRNIVRNAPWVSGPILRDVALVQFHVGTSQEARQAAVDRVGGRVVGGVRFGDDGIYRVRVPSEPGACALGRALSVLNRMPQVAAASPEMLGMGTVDTLPAGPPPPDLGVEDTGIKCGLFFSVQDSLDAEAELARVRADTLLRRRVGARP